MTDKQIIIDGFKLEYIKELLYTGQRSAITTKIFEEIIEKLESKEQECETLASQLDFEVQKKECLEQECEQQSWDIGNLGYKIKNQRHEINNRLKQLDQLRQECERFKEILKDKTDKYNKLAVNYDAYVSMANEQLDQLKAENENLKKYKEVVDKLAGMQVILTNENGVPQLYGNAKDLKFKQLSKTLAEIKEIVFELMKADKSYKFDKYSSKILQKISEVEDV